MGMTPTARPGFADWLVVERGLEYANANINIARMTPSLINEAVDRQVALRDNSRKGRILSNYLVPYRC